MSIAEVMAGERRWIMVEGDCLATMRGMPDASVDAVVCDPPAGIAFMGKAWDGDKGGRDHWIAWLAEIMREALRVLKPAGHALVWALPRTSHWTGTALEHAEWEIRDCLQHHFGSGFPKSMEPRRSSIGDYRGATREEWAAFQRHEGLGTALKPSTEFYWLARKPLIGTVAGNMLNHGTGALNIDGCRVGTTGARNNGRAASADYDRGDAQKFGDFGATEPEDYGKGRWPPHLLLTHGAGCVQVGTRRVKTGIAVKRNLPNAGARQHVDLKATTQRGPDQTHGDAEGMETIPDWDCEPGCPVRVIGEQSEAAGVHSAGAARIGSANPRETNESTWQGPATQDTGKMFRLGDAGTAARFFPTFRYVPKPSTAEKEAGVTREASTGGEATGRVDGSAGLENPRAGAGRNGGRRNIHPTTKPISLFRWLVRLITPPGGVILDPFAGSGTTGCAAMLEGFRFIGCELEPVHVEIANDRIGWWEQVDPDKVTTDDYTTRTPRPNEVDERQADLFGGES